MPEHQIPSRSWLCLATGLLAPCLGHGQQAGIYVGKQSGGGTISITVVEDTYLHKLAIASLTSQVSARCRNHEYYNELTRVAPGLVPINGNSVTYQWDFGTYYVNATMTFDDATNSVSGDIVSNNVIFGRMLGAAPTSATFCTDPDQHFEAVLTPGGSPGAAADVVFTKGFHPQ